MDGELELFRANFSCGGGVLMTAEGQEDAGLVEVDDGSSTWDGV